MSAAGRVTRRGVGPWLAWSMVLACLLSGACRTVTAPPLPAAAPVAPVPELAQRYRIDAASSQVLILVYRDGPMAKLGHNHLVCVHALSGQVSVLRDPISASFWLQFPVGELSVDDPALRAAQGEDFATRIDAAGIEGTRAHMLSERLLDAARFPVIRLQSLSSQVQADHWLVTLQMTVRDHDSTATVPISVALGEGELTANGEFDVTHAQLGLTPYSVGMGALRVAQVMHIRLHLVARRDPL